MLEICLTSSLFIDAFQSMIILICHTRLYARLQEEEQAAAAFTEYINETSKQGVSLLADTR